MKQPFECIAAQYSSTEIEPLGQHTAQLTIAAAENLEGCKPMSPNGMNQAILVRRGGCAFSDKAAHAHDAHYATIVIVDNDPSRELAPPGLGEAPVTIPVVMVSQSTGDNLIALVGSGNGGPGTSTSTISILFAKQSTKNTVPDVNSIYVKFSVVGGLVNQMWTIYNMLAFVNTLRLSGTSADTEHHTRGQVCDESPDNHSSLLAGVNTKGLSLTLVLPQVRHFNNSPYLWKG
jgi:hypothetical protein